MSDNALRSETKGYNRGLILGFTMAESLLLVVFCLLLVAGAFISKEKQRTLKAEQASAMLQEQLKSKDDRVDELKAQIVALTAKQPQTANPEAESEWRELVLARKVVDALTLTLSEKDPSKIAERVNTLLEKEASAAKELVDQELLSRQLADAMAKVAMLEETQAENAPLIASAKNSKPHEWPPIISLSEANGNYFKSGSAQLEVSFVDKLNGSISEQIAANLKNYGADIVEVIGHTDEQPVSRPASTMDKNAIDVLSSKKSVAALVPADNAGLGLARAISVANILKTNSALSGVTVLPLSGAQLILPGDTVTKGEDGAVETRRRIEIRIRRRDAHTD